MKEGTEMNRYPDQMMARQAKFMGCLRTAGMPDSFYQRVIDDKEFRDWLVGESREKLGANVKETENQKAARTIMGTNFLGLPEVVQHLGDLSEEQTATLAEVPFSEETLRACAETHVLVADIGLSTLDVRQKARRDLFYSYDDAWYNGDKFARETDEVCWRLIRKTPVDNSTSKTWGDQQKLIPETDEIPSARQVVYMVILHFLATGERLFEKSYVRTSFASSRDSQVFVGSFDGGGLSFNYYSDDLRYDYLGVSSSRLLGSSDPRP